MVPLGRVDLQTQLVEQGLGTDLGVPRRGLRVVEEGEVVHEGQQPGTHEGSAAAEPTAGGLGGDLGGGLGGRPAADLGVAEVLGEDLRELLEDEGAEGPALGNGREVIALAIDVQVRRSNRGSPCGPLGRRTRLPGRRRPTSPPASQ